MSFDEKTMSFDEFLARREQENDARLALIRVEIYRAAVSIFVASGHPCSETHPIDFTNAIHDAIKLWNEMDKISEKVRPY